MSFKSRSEREIAMALVKLRRATQGRMQATPDQAKTTRRVLEKAKTRGFCDSVLYPNRKLKWWLTASGRRMAALLEEILR